jgi:IS5 family transposase
MGRRRVSGAKRSDPVGGSAGARYDQPEGEVQKRILKRIFGFERVRYRGLKKNHQRLCTCFALVNLYLHRKRLAVA